ncbi:cation-transporting P-type ATPase [Mycolicibacterium holsaticum]|uniref:cation-transporting P-type ATPase n=1 Tax=Mycolicibacterium holsaticum TaxID=152142 RepID=UPI002329C109|nr:cation-transporting P-type ATPase [Mycolicibacterium holsaticum]MDA4109588.1 hypothetical protein [Mycolicibacterium holsaticum DSM 44478 = JCM 12374]
MGADGHEPGPTVLTAQRVAAAPVDEVMGWLNSSAGGLSNADAIMRLDRFGANAVRTHRVSALAVLGRQLRNAVLLLLAGTALVSYFLGDRAQAIIIASILAASIAARRIHRRAACFSHSDPATEVQVGAPTG